MTQFRFNYRYRALINNPMSLWTLKLIKDLIIHCKMTQYGHQRLQRHKIFVTRTVFTKTRSMIDNPINKRRNMIQRFKSPSRMINNRFTKVMTSINMDWQRNQFSSKMVIINSMIINNYKMMEKMVSLLSIKMNQSNSSLKHLSLKYNNLKKMKCKKVIN